MTYEIYQIPPGETLREIGFFGFDELTRIGAHVDPMNYASVYSGEIQRNGRDDTTIMDEIFYRFNTRHPADYHGRSMSVSDVITLDGKAFYVDQFGFVPLATFKAA